MKLGYPCINWSIGCKGNKTFRLSSYSEEKLTETVNNNLTCLIMMLEYNLKNDLMFFRLASEIVPFASHPICKLDWEKAFKPQLKEIGSVINDQDFRISMHPDQFVVINSPDSKVVSNSVAELEYHAQLLDSMGLNHSAKIQIHVGGVYGDKDSAIRRFIKTFRTLDRAIKNRLVIENDDKSYSLSDCLRIHDHIGIPIIFDVYHHSLLNDNLHIKEALEHSSRTWNADDGILMLDYSSAHDSGKFGKHTDSIDIKDFRKFIKKSKPYDFDIMLEIRDKEKSALKAVKVLQEDIRFNKK